MDQTTLFILRTIIDAILIGGVGVGLFRAVRRRIADLDRRMTAHNAEQRVALDRQTTEQANIEARVRRLELIALTTERDLGAIRTDLAQAARALSQLGDRAFMEDLLDRKLGRYPPPGAHQHVTVAGGERSAAVGGNAQHAPILTGNDNDLKQGGP